MTQDTYNNDVPLSADTGEIVDEFDGLEAGAEQAKPTSKAPVIALIALVIVAVAAFLTYQIFLATPDQSIAVADQSAPLPTPVEATPADTAALPPEVTPAVDPNTVAVDPNAVAAPTDPNAVTAEALAPTPEAQASADAATTIAPTDPAAAPVATPAAADVAAAPVAPAPAPAAEAALPTPSAEQLTPIDTSVATPLPTTAPTGTPDPNKVVDTMNAVNDILGAPVATAPVSAADAVNVASIDAAMAKQVEVTPRAKQVIFVKKSYNANSPQAVVASGDRVMEAGQYGDAVDIYDRQLKKNPSDPLALAGKAMAQQKAGRTQDAMNTYQRLLDLNPRDVEALTNYLGLLQKQDPTQALNRLHTLSQQYPESAAVAGQLATTQAGMLDTPNALRNFQKAAALDTSNPVYPFNLGVLYDRLGTSDKARDAYRTALALARENPDRAAGVPVETIRERLGGMSE